MNGVGMAHPPEGRIRYARSAGLNIAYQIVGDGPVDVVLSPGWVTHLDLAWDIPPLARFLGRLAQFSRLILFDKRGTGLSDRLSPDVLPSLNQRMEDVLAVMDAADSDRAVLFGTLGGGAMSGLFAATYPQRALGLILYGTFAKLEPDTGLLARLAGSPEAALERVEDEWGTESVCVAFWAPSLIDDEVTKASYLRLCRSSVSPKSALALMHMGYQVDWESVLPNVSVPTLVLHRSGDLVIPARQGRKLAEAIPDATYIELPGRDHLMWVGDQEPLLEAVHRFVTGLQPAPEPERVLTTVLFTDIVGSTEHAARVGDREWKRLLETHHRIVREHLAGFGGREIDTAGDGFLATFAGPAGAIRCASALTPALESIGLRVRVGIHTGECEVVEGGIRGIAVHVAARIMSEAGRDEVLVSSTVRDLVAGSGITFTPRGSRQLKGVPGEVSLFVVDACPA
jgi:class 3 adenylate cyclase